MVFIWLRAEPMLSRILDIMETKSKQAPPPKDDPIPADMLASTLAYPEAWAREQALSRLRELRNETGSWDGARNIWLREVET